MLRLNHKLCFWTQFLLCVGILITQNLYVAKPLKCLTNHSISTTERKGNLKKKGPFVHYFNIVCTAHSVENNI